MNGWLERIRKQNSAEILKCLCTILFFLFAFVFLSNYQDNVLAYGIYSLSGTSLLYHDIIGAIILTALLLFLQRTVNSYLDISPRWYACSFIPSFLILILLMNLCMLPVHEMHHLKEWFAWIILTISSVLIYYRDKSKEKVPSNWRPTNDIIWKNLFLMAAFMFLTGMLTGAKDTINYRLDIERNLVKRNFAKALQVGETSLSNDSSLFALRVYALSKENLLGEKLFEYPVIASSKAMIADGITGRTLMYPQAEIYRYLQIDGKVYNHSLFEILEKKERNGVATRSMYDYLLCGYLLDKKLDLFARTIHKAYNVKKNLPRYYKEALILYKHLRSNPVVDYSHAVLETDYKDFQELENKYQNPILRNNKLRDVYGDTYWYYYANVQ